MTIAIHGAWVAVDDTAASPAPLKLERGCPPFNVHKKI